MWDLYANVEFQRKFLGQARRHHFRVAITRATMVNIMDIMHAGENISGSRYWFLEAIN